jgi:hypothetical protein
MRGPRFDLFTPSETRNWSSPFNVYSTFGKLDGQFFVAYELLASSLDLKLNTKTPTFHCPLAHAVLEKMA